MLRLSDQARVLLDQLLLLQSDRSWFGRSRVAGQIISLLERIAEQREVVFVHVIARSLFDSSTDVRKSACRAIHRILGSLPPDALLHLSAVIQWSWGRYISDPWDKLKPAEVAPLIADPSTAAGVLGLLSFHGSGYVRQESVRLLAEIHDGGELPFLLLRQNDWVKPVSADAREAVRSRLKEANLSAFLRCLPLVVHLLKFSRNDHSPLVYQVIELLLRPEQDAALSEVLRSSDRNVRREVFRIALNLDGEHQPRVVAHGLDSTDAVVRFWCARKVRQCSPLAAIPQMIQRLQQDRYMPVRREGFSLEADTHPDRSQSVWQKAMLDLNASIRDLARFHLQKSPAFNAARFYRQTLATHGSFLAAVYGLGETGDLSGLPLLRGFLKARLPSWRRAAVRGLAALGKDCVALELVECLRDKSRGVIRETSRGLLPWLVFVPGEALLSIVMEGESEFARRTALRLIFEKGKWDSLPWLIRAADHQDSSVASSAQSFIEAWFTRPLCNRIFTKPSPLERQAIEEAFSAKRGSLPKPFSDKLAGWLTEP